tara:strand:+ start:2279 stop:4609 length:2331 start_codon:yes stop_codon:yes gene_type:complete
MTRIVAVGRPSGGTGSMDDGYNSIAYSDNSGVSWTPALYNGGTTKNLFSTRGYDVLYNKAFNRWIAVGQGTNTIAYSTDGANYSITDISWTTAQFSNARAIACNDSRWVIVGEGTHSIAYSDDGYSWTGVTNKTIFSDFGYGVDCVGTTWVAVGKSDDASAYVMACSTDNGVTWFDVSYNSGGGSRSIFAMGRDVTSYGTLFVAGGTFSFPSTLNTLAYSYDGINWEGLGIGVLRDGPWRIATNGSRWIAVGANNTTSSNRIAYSDNPTNSSSWVEVNDQVFGSFGRGVCWAGGDIWIALGALDPKIKRSIDNGLTWIEVVEDEKVFNFLGVGANSNFSVELVNNGTIALGEGTNTMAYSDDNGLTWKAQNLDFFTKGFALGWNGSRLVAGGNGTSSLAYSSDGLNWNVVANSNNLFTDVRDFAYSSLYSRWVAVGEGNNTIAYSSDGISWTAVTNSTSLFSNKGYGVEWNGSRFVAVGWGTNSILYSNDGITWTAVTNSTSIFSTFANGVASNGTYWVVVGQGTNTIAYSFDNGINWTGLGTSNMTAPAKISYNGNRLIIVGYGPTHPIIYSDNGVTWNNANNSSSVFSVGGNNIAWNGSRWVAVGSSSGGNSIAYSNDNGINWTNIEDSSSIFSVGGYAVIGYTYPERPIPEEEAAIFDKSMPKKFGYSDSGNGFMLGRRAFSQNIHLSHESSNLPANNSAQGRPSTASGIVPKPLNNNSSDLRLQRLRLSTIGSSSLRVPDNNTNISYKSVDQNFVNSARSRVRGAGGGGPKR